MRLAAYGPVVLFVAACSNQTTLVSSGTGTSTSTGQGGGTGTGGGGMGGSCDASQVACGSHCLNEELFCSACFGWCLDECSSRCGPMSLLATVSGPPPGPIALDDTLVYFGTGMMNGESNSGSVMAVPKAGGVPFTLVPATGFIASLAVDSHFVYWGENGSWSGAIWGPGPVKMAPKQGGPPTVLVDKAVGLVIDATHLYYWRSGGTLEKMPLGGGTPVVLATNVADTIFDIALNGAGLYWNDRSNGAINGVPLGGGTPTQLVIQPSTPVAPNALAVDSAFLYWIGRAGNPLQLWRSTLDGSDPTLLFTGQPYDSDDLVVDPTGIYFSTFVGIDAGSTIERVPPTGGSATALSEGPGMMPPDWAHSAIHGLALDANYVYWTSSRGYVAKTAK